MAADSHDLLFGFPLKWVSLVTLIIQNSALALLLRYSQTAGRSSRPYLPSTAVVTSECLKFIVCLIVHIRAETSRIRAASSLSLSSSASNLSSYTLRTLMFDMFGPNSDWLKMTVPAILYFIQNNLQYVAVRHLDAATFQVTYQLKILTTALFSVWLLGRTLGKLKWVSLCLLTFGIALVQYDPSKGKNAKAAGDGLDDDRDGAGMERLVGLAAVGVACVLSGLAGVWFERVLKESQSSLFLRNLQLGIFSIIPGFFFGVWVVDGPQVYEHGFFQGYNIWTVAAILCQAVGGLIVAVVVKYADNILKGFATSISIILSCIASVFLFDFRITVPFTVGAGIVLYATHLYGQPDPRGQSKRDSRADLAYLRLEDGNGVPGSKRSG
ncbi:hypothetical protein HK104_008933 [Borealophlyctis nickersoniae]|nr:hypothetical protein HK104_008933 [Borealophlyctis nickersoniae]